MERLDVEHRYFGFVHDCLQTDSLAVPWGLLHQLVSNVQVDVALLQGRSVLVSKGLGGLYRSSPTCRKIGSPAEVSP